MLILFGIRNSEGVYFGLLGAQWKRKETKTEPFMLLFQLVVSTQTKSAAVLKVRLKDKPFKHNLQNGSFFPKRKEKMQCWLKK